MSAHQAEPVQGIEPTEQGDGAKEGLQMSQIGSPAMAQAATPTCISFRLPGHTALMTRLPTEGNQRACQGWPEVRRMIVL